VNGSLDQARKETAALLIFIEGAEDTGGADAGPELRRRARIVARALLDLADQLDAERSARVAIQTQRDTLQRIVGGAAYLDLTERLRREAR